MDEEQNDLWLEEESEENSEEVSWAESILDFVDWNQDEDAPVCDEELEEALAEERNAALESELEQDEHPLEAEDDIPEDADSAESPISLNTLRQQMDETAVERISLAARTETDFSVELYEHLLRKNSLTLREKEFVALYAASLKQSGKSAAKVKRENKTPPRKKSGLTESEN